MSEVNTPPTIIAKMSMKALETVPQKVASGDKNSLAMARVYGIASGIKGFTNGQTGEVAFALMGDFEGVNIETGKVFRSGKLFLPGGIHESLTGPFMADDPVTSLKFALEFEVVKAGNPAGYTWRAKPLIAAAQNDPLASLRDELPALAALPAPAPETTTVETVKAKK